MDDDWVMITHYLMCRSGGRCELCGQLFSGLVRPSRHHRLARGMGGTSDPEVHRLDRLMLICGGALAGVTGCHGYVEHHPTEAEANGWKVRHGGGSACDTTTAPVLLYGLSATLRPRWVLLDPYGPAYLPAAPAAA